MIAVVDLYLMPEDFLGVNIVRLLLSVCRSLTLLTLTPCLTRLIEFRADVDMSSHKVIVAISNIDPDDTVLNEFGDSVSFS